MKGIVYFFVFIFITTTLYAENKEIKWIPLKPIHSEEKMKVDSNRSTLNSSTQMIQNLKIIKNLLDHVNKDGVNTENEKNWYTLEPAGE